MAGRCGNFKPECASIWPGPEKDNIMSNPTPPVPLVEVTRSDEIESIHYGHFAVAAPDGSIIDGAGDAEFVTYPRSALKPIQALHLVESGAADAYRLEDKHLCLAC